MLEVEKLNPSFREHTNERISTKTFSIILLLGFLASGCAVQEHTQVFTTKGVGVVTRHRVVTKEYVPFDPVAMISPTLIRQWRYEHFRIREELSQRIFGPTMTEEVPLHQDPTILPPPSVRKALPFTEQPQKEKKKKKKKHSKSAHSPK